MKATAPKIISLREWAKKNNLSDRHTRRLAQEGKIKTVPLAVYIAGVREDFKL